MAAARTVLVTGATSGIGRACAKAFSGAGNRVIVCGRREDRLAGLVEDLDGPAHAAVTDVRDPAAVARLVDELPADWRDIDVLVNNAGLAAGFGPLHEGDPDDWQRMIDTNVAGLLHVTRAVVPGMVARGRGDVVSVGSVAGRGAYPNGAVYCASKAAVASITDGLRHDLLGSGVRVALIEPGLVRTEFSLVRFGGDRDRADGVYEGATPLSAEDVADTVLWMTGRPPHVLVADVLLLATDQASATDVARR